MIPARGLLVVTPIDSEERFPGSRVILTPITRERMTSTQWEVVAVGKPTLCDTSCDCGESPEVPDVEPGDWIVTLPRAAVTTPCDIHFLVRYEDVVAVLEER